MQFQENNAILNKLKRCVAQFGRALRSGRRGRRFKSCRIDSLAGAPEALRNQSFRSFFARKLQAMQKEKEADSEGACSRKNLFSFLFIGRQPATEMKRSGIEVHGLEISEGACSQRIFLFSIFIGRMPATEMKRSGIEVHVSWKYKSKARAREDTTYRHVPRKDFVFPQSRTFVL